MAEKQPAPEDVIACQAATFEWAESHDTKDWDRLLRIATPTLLIDFRKLMNQYWEAIPAEEYITKLSDPGFLGTKRIQSQHLVGVGKFVQKAEDYIVGTHQTRVTQIRYMSEDSTEIQRRGYVSGVTAIHYRKVDGVWKWAGVEPGIRWTEYDFDKIFYQDD